MRTVQVVAITQVAILIGFNFSFPFLPLFIQELGVRDRSELALWTGIAVGTGGISMALISPVWGVLADRFGRKAMLVRSVASGSVVLALQAAVGNVSQLVAVRAVQGAFTGTQTAGAMLLAGIVPPRRTGFALGLVNTAVQVGNLIGPVLGGIVVVAVGLRTSFLIGALLLAVCAVATFALVQEGHRVRRDDLPIGVRGNVRDVFVPFGWPGLRGVLVVGTALQVVYSGSAAVLAIYVQDLARPAWLTTEMAVGLAFALGALAAAVAMPVLGSYADGHDPRTMLAVSLGVIAAGLLPQVVVPSAVVLLVCRIPVGFGIAGATSAVAVLTRMGARPGGEGRAFGALASAQNFGWGFGPIVGSAFAAAAGIPALYVAAAALLTLMLIAVVNTPHWFARRAVEPHAPAVPVIGADPAD
jgi:MFS family permease